jgi:hypothetical protein
VLTDEGALDEMAALGVRQLPLVTKGGRWVNGQSLKAVAALCGIQLGEIRHLPPVELVRRIDLVIEAAQRFFGQFPADRLDEQTPGRPRSYAQLTYHLFNVVDAFLEHERGIALVEGSYKRHPAPGMMTRTEIVTYGSDVRRRFAEWWEGAKERTDWTAKANVYYGDVSRHEFLERTTWHSGQHSRQLVWLLKEKFSIDADRPLGPEMWVGLPMPEQIWDG